MSTYEDPHDDYWRDWRTGIEAWGPPRSSNPYTIAPEIALGHAIPVDIRLVPTEDGVKAEIDFGSGEDAHAG